MNKKRRNRIQKVIDALRDAGQELNEIAEDEEEAFGNMPEGVQGSDKGVRMEDAVNQLSEAAEAAGSAADSAEEALEA